MHRWYHKQRTLSVMPSAHCSWYCAHYSSECGDLWVPAISNFWTKSRRLGVSSPMWSKMKLFYLFLWQNTAYERVAKLMDSPFKEMYFFTYDTYVLISYCWGFEFLFYFFIFLLQLCGAGFLWVGSRWSDCRLCVIIFPLLPHPPFPSRTCHIIILSKYLSFPSPTPLRK